ncbi:phosphodiesterase [Coralliovum pocilloporae]|uniref:phosphodiesterase n=1 Tax=Coralliovum pocilloporae TaxID=3066369 RepID=UPI0033075360
MSQHAEFAGNPADEAKIIWLSDPHFIADGLVLGHDPRQRLSAVISHINAHHSDAAFCVISGDMVNRGSPEDYAALAEHLQQLTIPYYPLVGNHDDRALFRASLALPASVTDDFIQYEVEVGNRLILALDTQKAGSGAGLYCEERQAWLRQTLERAGDRRVILFMHHHPVPLGLPMQDTEGLENGAEFMELLSAYRDRIDYLCIGHVHRPITGIVNGFPLATMRSVLYQAPAPEPAWDWNSFRPAEEAPNMGVLRLSSTGVLLHYHQFCPYGLGT